MSELNSVFISYRRDVAAFVAQAVWQDLYINGLDAFYDLESIHADQFDSLIMRQIAARPYFILILTPGSLERCTAPSDWVRREIAEAIRLQRRIVPLHTSEFDFADIEHYLPAEIATELKRWNAVPLPSRYFKWAMQEIRTDYLKPIELPVISIPAADEAQVVHMQQEAALVPDVTEQQLVAQEALYRGHNHTQRRDSAAAIEEYSEALRLDPTLVHAYLNRGIAHKKLGNFSSAIDDFMQVIALKPHMSSAYYHLGQIYYAQCDYPAAIDSYSQLLNIAPSHVVAYVQRGNAHFANGEVEVALADYQRASELLVSDEGALAGLAIAHHALGHTQEAQRLWQRICQSEPQFRDPHFLSQELNWVAPLIAQAEELISELS